jgi:hypothetical protein
MPPVPYSVIVQDTVILIKFVNLDSRISLSVLLSDEIRARGRRNIQK